MRECEDRYLGLRWCATGSASAESQEILRVGITGKASGTLNQQAGLAGACLADPGLLAFAASQRFLLGTNRFNCVAGPSYEAPLPTDPGLTTYFLSACSISAGVC